MGCRRLLLSPVRKLSRAPVWQKALRDMGRGPHPWVLLQAWSEVPEGQGWAGGQQGSIRKVLKTSKGSRDPWASKHCSAGATGGPRAAGQGVQGPPACGSVCAGLGVGTQAQLIQEGLCPDCPLPGLRRWTALCLFGSELPPSAPCASYGSVVGSAAVAGLL